jgi:hypothetical protein
MTSYPPPPSTGAPAPPPYGAPAPPSSGPYSTQAVTVPPAAWLVPLAAVLALVGAFTPWFKAKATASAAGQTIHHTFDGLYSFKDGKIGLLAPILLVVLAIGVVGLLLGRSPARFSRGSAHPVASAGKAAVVVGVLSLICTLIAWFLVKSQYKFKESGKEYSWDDYIKVAKAAGVKLELSRGPQLGYFLTIAAGVVAIIGGVLMILAARGASAAPSGYQPGAAPGGYQPPPPGGYQPQQPPPGYQPQAPGGYQPPPPPPGYEPQDPGAYPPPPPPQAPPQ